ncbi:Exosome complex component RRP4, partial [Acipenser ruthenus]
LLQVQQKRWKVETNSRLDSVLLLSSVNLPGGELLGQGVLVQVSPSLVKRRKTHFHNLLCGASIILGNNGYVWIYPTPAQQDEEAGGFFTSTEPVPLCDREVISRLQNCILALSAHKVLLYDTSVLYCFESSLAHQLGQGVLVQVSPSLVKRRKTHFHNLLCGASIILGNNGYVWIYPTPAQQDEEAGGFFTSTEPVPLCDREVISRLQNCILALSAHKVLLYDTSVLYCYESSLAHQIKDTLKPEVMEEIVMETRQRLVEQEG